MIDYTTVIGVDAGHLEQLRLTFPTWIRHKPSLLDHPLVVFADIPFRGPDWKRIEEIVGIHTDVTYYNWPPPGVEYTGDPATKWYHPQRYRMLSGFVHVPARIVGTKYWLKLDLDVVATGQDDWIDPRWFDGDPAIVAQAWHYTKPPEQMDLLDNWTNTYLDLLSPWIWQHPPLGLHPKSGATLLKHKRIISWCGFFNTEFTETCSAAIESICGVGKLPCPSQDGVLWYFAVRGGFPIERVNMKARGWVHCANTKAIKRTIEGQTCPAKF